MRKQANILSLYHHPVVRILLAVGWTVFITILLVQSSSEPVIGPAAPPGPPSPDREALLILGHFCIFAVLTLLWWWAVEHYMSVRDAMATALTIAIVLGISTEFVQGNIPDRTPSLLDMSTNISASFLAIGLIYIGSMWLPRSS